MKATEVTAGLAESNGSLLPGLWRDSSVHRDQLRAQCSVMSMEKLYLLHRCPTDRRTDADRPRYNHGHNHRVGPVGRVPSNFGDHWDRVYFGPLQLLQLAAIFRCALWEALTDLLAEFKGEGKKSREGTG